MIRKLRKENSGVIVKKDHSHAVHYFLWAAFVFKKNYYKKKKKTFPSRFEL